MFKIFYFVVFIVAYCKIILAIRITEMDLALLDPFIVDKVKLNHEYGVVKVNGTVYNIKLQGLATTTIQKLSGFDKNLLEIHYKNTKYTFTGFFKAKSEIFGFQLNTAGSFLLNTYDVAAKLIIKLERYTRNGKTYFRTNGFDVSSTIKSGDLDLTGVNRALMWLINANFNIIIQSSIKSYIGDVWAVYYEKAINAMLTKVPIRELFQCETVDEGSLSKSNVKIDSCSLEN
ncbi:unnamed protein product [Chironomus riparius]|uniref:Uncharacterized protein n=1 Tax=Chironomus riparius TaxID=315576 RepID=A0A9N9RXP1_9DIPT|nr:unnamed protein product [Chironomus riparius]